MFRLFLILITFFAISLFSKEFKDDGYYRYVQVLAIRDFSRAQIVMKKLEEHGYEYIVRDSIKKGEQYFRVVVGPFSKNSIKQEQETVDTQRVSVNIERQFLCYFSTIQDEDLDPSDSPFRHVCSYNRNFVQSTALISFPIIPEVQQNGSLERVFPPHPNSKF